MGGLAFTLPFFGIALPVIVLLLRIRPSAGSSWGKPASDPGTSSAVLGSVPRLSTPMPVDARPHASPAGGGRRPSQPPGYRLPRRGLPVSGPDVFPSGPDTYI